MEYQLTKNCPAITPSCSLPTANAPGQLDVYCNCSLSMHKNKPATDCAESYGDVRGQLERGGEPIDGDFYARWLKSKGSLDEAETCIRAHAAWREAFVTRGRIQEVCLCSASAMRTGLSCTVHSRSCYASIWTCAARALSAKKICQSPFCVGDAWQWA